MQFLMGKIQTELGDLIFKSLKNTSSPPSTPTNKNNYWYKCYSLYHLQCDSTTRGQNRGSLKPAWSLQAPRKPSEIPVRQTQSNLECIKLCQTLGILDISNKKNFRGTPSLTSTDWLSDLGLTITCSVSVSKVILYLGCFRIG